MIINTLNNVKKTIFFTLFFLTQNACACIPVSTSDIKQFPTKSFVQIFKTVKIKKCKPKTVCRIGEYTSTGSGGVIGRTDGFVAIITARHVCITKFNKEVEQIISQKETHVGVRTWTNQIIPAEILHVSSNPLLDLCVLKVIDFGVPVVKISVRKPKVGDTVYALSAPAGVYHPPTVPILSGIYSGMLEDKVNSLTTIPATGGSSGSLVLNSNKQIVGIIFASVRAFPLITLSSSYKETRNFIKESIKILKSKTSVIMSEVED